MIVTTIKTADDLRWVRHGFAILVGWISLYAILQWIGGFGAEPYISEIPRRASSIFPYPNALGLLLAPILVYLWHHAHERWVKGIIAIGILGLLTTVSQGAWLATAGGIFFPSLFTRWRKWTLIGSFTALPLTSPHRAHTNNAHSTCNLSRCFWGRSTGSMARDVESPTRSPDVRRRSWRIRRSL